ncbi:chromosomal replication initiator protein DnaA [Novimethylophilus kurashikiensis]|uniref:Chromosomal replication initiator protein DnaA n=1 Tax=Novimethylophilus kurashikiensis TaxID=1825523 RepID=A0A2R5FBX2_9PROT|nr:hypothetical protein [Novimethylophilus kurashikiensis]GBG15712.1 chromosomal replication initiator protein DnaA [Novimethylophilus kurashikiensis]
MFSLFTPLDKHLDNGFGAVADSFREAADILRTAEGGISPFHGHLPISYLYRHAIELYLKASIIIFHRHLRVPYGKNPYHGEPYVLVEGLWKPMYNEHRISPLYNYLKFLLSDNQEYLAENTRTDWSFPEGFDSLIENVHEIDSSSTYFRYPVTKAGDRDKEKSSAKQTTMEEVIAHAGLKKKPLKTMVVVSALDEVQRVFVHDNESSIELVSRLHEVAETLHGCHTALIGELVGFAF